MWPRNSKPEWSGSTARILFDASCGFGGYRESGYGREGGREGLLEYLEPAWFKNAPALPAAETAPAERNQRTIPILRRRQSTAR